MPQATDEEGLLKSVALQNAKSIFAARQRDEEVRARLAALQIHENNVKAAAAWARKKG